MSDPRPFPFSACLLLAAALAAGCRSTAEEEPREAAPARPEAGLPGTGSGAAERDAEQVSYEVVARGTQARLAAPMARVFRSRAGWQEAWSQAPPTQVGEQQAAPEVGQLDWSDQMLAVIALGERPSAGYGVEVLGVERSGGFLRIRARETKPAPDRMQAQVVTQPYVVLQLPRFEGPVVFVIE